MEGLPDRSGNALNGQGIVSHERRLMERGSCNSETPADGQGKIRDASARKKMGPSCQPLIVD